MADAVAEAPVPALEVSGLSKSFNGRAALRPVDLEVVAGEIHAVVGQNGCGKSTLVKCLAGYHIPDSGRVSVAGNWLPEAYGPREASRAGLRFVHQDLGIVKELSVLENLRLGRGFFTGAARRIRWEAEVQRTRAVLHRANCDGVAPSAPAGVLSVTAHAMIAIARAMGSDDAAAKVIVLDEPSASLPEDDVQVLHESIRAAARDGVGILLVSHRMSEVFRLANRVTVLRDGQKVGTYEMGSLGEHDLAKLIVGQSVDQQRREFSDGRARKAPRLRVRGLTGGIVSNLDFDIARGEVLGLAGLRGSGRSTVARLVAGVQHPTAGSISVERSDAEGPDRGVGSAPPIVYVPEERKTQGALADMTVLENLLMPQLKRFRTSWGRLDRRRMVAAGAGLAREYGVRTPSLDAPITALSGGNQQKVILARWLSLGPKVAVLDEPFQGIDIGAKSEIFTIIRTAARNGISVLIIDSDFENLCRICDRILVMHLGQVAEEVDGDRVTQVDHVARSVLMAHMDLGMELEW